MFVPTIGFRPCGTRTLLERAETAADGIHLAVLAVAATTEHTELIVEWEWQGDPITLVVPFIEISDWTPSVAVDLRQLPLDVELGGHRFRVLSAEAYPGSDHRQIKLAIAPSTTSPRFVRPAALHGAPRRGYSWHDAPERGEPFWMETVVSDPPLVTFRGAVLRHEGPWRVELPLV